MNNSSSIEILHIYNSTTCKAVEPKTRAGLRKWADFISGKSTGKRVPAEDLARKYPNVKNFYRAIVKDPKSGYTFHVYFEELPAAR